MPAATAARGDGRLPKSKQPLAQGAIWLTDDRLSAYDYWQFWRNTDDADVGRFLRLFTDLPLDEIGRLERLQGSEINQAKQVLATEATALCHGRAAAEAAQETARRVFTEGATGSELRTVTVPRADCQTRPPARPPPSAGLTRPNPARTCGGSSSSTSRHNPTPRSTASWPTC